MGNRGFPFVPHGHAILNGIEPLDVLKENAYVSVNDDFK